MIHIVTSANRALYEAQIEETFRLRHDFYVKERGWKDLEKPDGREIDQYDDERTVYLFHIGEDDHVDGSFRLYPTDEKSLMADRFSHLVNGGAVPTGLDIYEITRWFMSPAARREAGKARSPLGAKLLCGLMEFAVRRRLKSYNLVCDTFFMPRMLAAGWDVKPLGLPQDYPEGTAIAVTIGVGAEMLEHSRKLMGMQHPITYEAPPPLEGRVFTAPSLGGRWAAAYESIRDERLRQVLTSTAERAAQTDLELAFATCEAALIRLEGEREPVMAGAPQP